MISANQQVRIAYYQGRAVSSVDLLYGVCIEQLKTALCSFLADGVYIFPGVSRVLILLGG